MSLNNSNKNIVIVTGFGPFGHYKINASWEAVKLIPSFLDTDKTDIKLIIEEIPVEYEETLARIIKLQEKHKPIVCSINFFNNKKITLYFL